MERNNTFRLSQKNLMIKIFEYNGLFCEHIPYCFNTEKLSSNIVDLKNDLIHLSSKSAFPLSFTMNKNGILRRTISVPNIIAYIKLLKVYEENWKEILKKASSSCSESKIGFLTPFHYQTNFKNSISARTNKFVGYKIKLHIDIANCFDSIYTHSVSWAMVGKDNAKKIFNKASDRDASLETLYNIGQKIDDATRKLNGDQTNGILTGPYTSIIFSEIILSEIDRILIERDFSFTRYVDDYSFYLFSKTEAEQKIQEIAQIFREYNFIINNDKIEIEDYPYDLLDDFNSVFENDIKNGDLYSLLHKALNLYKENKKGAIKYALKILLNQEKSNFSKESLLNMLLNIIINIPEISSLGIQLLEKNLDPAFAQKYFKRLNQLLNAELKNNHEHESMWLLYLITKLELPLSIENVKLALQTKNDLLIIICLDAIDSNPNKIYRLDGKNKIDFTTCKSITQIISEELETISNLIKNEDYTGTHWLLMYEVAYHDLRLNNTIKIHKAKSYKFYSLLCDKSISFYKRIKPTPTIPV